MEQQTGTGQPGTIEIHVIEGALAELTQCARTGNGSGAGEERSSAALDHEVEELGFRILGYIPSVPFDGRAI